MSKRVLWSLVLIAVTAVVLILNRGTVELDLGFTAINLMKSFAFLIFTGLGVAIGLLLK